MLCVYARSDGMISGACMQARTHAHGPRSRVWTLESRLAWARAHTDTPDKEFFALAHGVFNEAEDLLCGARNDTCSCEEMWAADANVKRGDGV